MKITEVQKVNANLRLFNLPFYKLKKNIIKKQPLSEMGVALSDITM